MKNTLLFVVLIMAGTVHGQQIRDVKLLEASGLPSLDASGGDYYKDLSNEMDKFVGTWLFVGSNNRVELVITKLLYQPFIAIEPTIYTDKLSVEFKYFENGLLIKESAPGFFTDLDQIQLLNILTNNEIGPNNPYDTGYSIVNGNYTEPFYSNCSRPQMGQLWLFYKTQNNIVNGVSTTGKLFWEVRTRALNRNMTGVTCADNYVLPANMVFIKQP